MGGSPPVSNFHSPKQEFPSKYNETFNLKVLCVVFVFEEDPAGEKREAP